MGHVLIVYGTSQGQAAKIGRAMADELRGLGHSADAWNVTELPFEGIPAHYSAIIVGASVHARGFQRALERWVKANSQALSAVPSAFYSVCLGVLQKDARVQSDVRKIVQEFLERTGWKPRTWKIFAGALPYTRYNWLLKRIMRSISRKAGGDTDITRDFEYTDWGDVRQFARASIADIPLASNLKV